MRPLRRRGRRVAALLAATLAVSGVGVATAPLVLADEAPSPSVVGAWSAPFEEGGADAPRCASGLTAGAATAPSEQLACKPPAVASAVLPDGRVLYGAGLDSQESVDGTPTRTLDMRDGAPSWHVPEHGSAAPASDAPCSGGQAAGVAGVPGRGGDGLIGSVVSQTGVETEPSCASGEAQNGVSGADIVQLADGRQLVLGGADSYDESALLGSSNVLDAGGLRTARVFDPTGGADGLGSWEATGPMKFPRWNPSGLTLPDGSVAVVSGSTKVLANAQASQVRRVETFDPGTGKWTEHYNGLTSEKSLPQNARVYLAPDGRMFYTGDGQMFGPYGQAVDEALFADQGFFDFATNEWTSAGATIPRSSPASVALPMKAPYDEMTILRAGGTLGPAPGGYVAVPTTDLTTINADGRVVNRAGPELQSARWFSQPTPLPTGEVLLTSGARNDEVAVPGADLPVRTPEIYDPATNKFRSVAEPERVRTYRNNAVLLPNGQVLVGGNSPIALGSGVPGGSVPGLPGNGDKDPSFELYSPPYLFPADGRPRPHIDSVQQGLAWNTSVNVLTKDAPTITKITLMRLPSPQHVMDNDNRTLELPFAQTADNAVTVEMPRDGVAAPPGYYYLFLNRSVDGHKKSFVPSVARIVHVGATQDRSPAAEPMGAPTLPRAAAPAEAETDPGAQGSDPAAAPDVLGGLPVPDVAGPADPGLPADPASNLPVDPQQATLPTVPSSSSGRRGRRTVR